VTSVLRCEPSILDTRAASGGRGSTSRSNADSGLSELACDRARCDAVAVSYLGECVSVGVDLGGLDDVIFGELEICPPAADRLTVEMTENGGAVNGV